VFRSVRSSNTATYRPTWWVLVLRVKAFGVDAAGLERSILCGIMLLSVELLLGFGLTAL